MNYFYRRRNKYPHVIEHDAYTIEQLDFFEIWMEENIGDEHSEWIILRLKKEFNDVGGYNWIYPVAFKTIEQAMAFKLKFA